jgi:hypothetical protein
MLLTPLPASSQASVIYVWQDTNGGSRFSNLAPTWYTLPEQPGPRVRVYRYNKLIDDTALSPAGRAALGSRAAGPSAAPNVPTSTAGSPKGPSAAVADSNSLPSSTDPANKDPQSRWLRKQLNGTYELGDDDPPDSDLRQICRMNGALQGKDLRRTCGQFDSGPK